MASTDGAADGRTGDAAAGHGITVSTAGGETLEADLVICATGVRSNTGWLEGSGVEVDLGIVVDDCMATSADGVYAAGDVAQGKDLSTGDYYVQAIQPTAVEHGKLAAKNMVNGNATPRAGTVNMNVLDTVGLISTSFGLWMGVEGGEEATLSNPERFEYLNLQFKGDVLVGASSLGMTDHVGVLRGLIQTGCRLGDWKDVLLEGAEPHQRGVSRQRPVAARLAGGGVRPTGEREPDRAGGSGGLGAGLRGGARDGVRYGPAGGPRSGGRPRSSAAAPVAANDGVATMPITLKLYATLQHLLPRGTVRNAAAVEVPAGASLNRVIDDWKVPRELAHLVLVNGVFVCDADRDAPDALQPGDVLAIWPPVAGG